MIGRKTCLGLILARGGSKRIPKKNMATVAGRPLIYWTIEAAKRSNTIDRIVVSSDDSEILEYAEAEGVERIDRPEELSQDCSNSMDAVDHALRTLLNAGTDVGYFFLLQPTSPLRSAEDLDGAAELLISKNADAIVGMTEVEHPLVWSTTLASDGSLGAFFRQNKQFRQGVSDDRNFRINGAIYLSEVERFLFERTMFFETNIYAYVMSRERSIDIDEPIDLQFAELEIQKTLGVDGGHLRIN